ncbi:MAG: hypothetical protein Q7T54_03620, partial [Candidatus Levybacteria bacterium]|nr:hypothetical protein [Candidatus Levybacteria bacterium]
GTGNLVLASDFNTSVLIGNATTPAPLSISGGIGGNAALVVNQENSGDLITASASGVTKFAVANDGTIRLYGATSGYTGLLAPAAAGNNILTLPTGNGVSGQALVTDGSGVLSWSSVATGFNAWDAANGAINAKSGTYDLLLGGNSTASAKFAVLNMSTGTPTASISANATDNATFITGAGNLGTTNAQTLTIGGTTTGNVVINSGSSAVSILDNTSITGTVTSSDSFLVLENGGGSDYGSIDVAAITGNQTYTLSGTGGTIWTSGNDGSGSTLDADTLDTIDSGSFLRSDVTDTFTSGTLNIGTGTTFNVNAGSTIDINSTNLTIADTDIIFDGATTTFSFNGGFTIDSGDDILTLAATDTTLSATGLTTITSAATLGISATTLNLGGGSAATIGTVSNDSLTITPNGTGELTLTSDADTGVNIGTSTNTPAPLSISGGIGGNAALIVNQTNSGDILAASSSGVTRFVVTNSGNVGVGTTTPTLTEGNFAAIMATGGAQFSSFSGSGLIDCNNAVDVLKWDATTKKFSCGSAVGQVKSFVDATTDAASDDNTTNYWDGTQPNITLNDSTNTILIQMSVGVLSNTANDTVTDFQMHYDTTGDGVAACTDTTVGDIFGGFTSTNNTRYNATQIATIAANDPDKIAFTICANDASDFTGSAPTIQTIAVVLTEVNNTADIAEIYPTNDLSLRIGDLVSIDPELSGGVIKASGSANTSFLGVVSTRPAKVIGSKGPVGANGLPIALSGRVPVKVTTLNGNIASGSAITTSVIDGFGAKQVSTSYVAGRAFEGTSNWNSSYCPVINDIAKIPWPDDDGSNYNHPCFAIPTSNVPNVPASYSAPYVYVGKVMMFVGTGLQTPKELVNNNQNLQVDMGINIPGAGSESASLYLLHDGSGNIFENEGAFSDILAANGTFGALTAEKITTSKLNADLVDLGSISMTATAGGTLSFINESNQEIFSLDNLGNATLSGTLTTVGGNYDVAEDFLTRDMGLEAGEIATIDPENSGFVMKATSAYDRNAVGIYSTSPGFRLSQLEVEAGTKAVPIALAGRVPVKVSLSSEPIEPGDYVTSSDEPGRAMKALKAGQMVGKALESWTPASGKDTVLVFVTVTYADPKNTLSELTLDENGNVVVSYVSASSVKLPADLTINGAETDGTLTGALTSLNDALAIADSTMGLLRTDILGIASRAAELDNRVATLENEQASASAQIAQTQEETASISSRVSGLIETVNGLIARTVSTGASGLGLTPTDDLISTGSGEIISINSTSTSELADDISTYSLTVNDTFKSLGLSYLGNTSISGDLTVSGQTYLGNTNIVGDVTIGDIAITSNSINVSGVTDVTGSNSGGILYLQSSSLANGLDIFNGEVTIDKNGTISAKGNVKVGGNLELEGAITITATAGATIKAKDALYVAEDGTVMKADSTIASRSVVVGIAANDAKIGEKVTIIIGGKAKGFSNLETGKRYYLNTNGGITFTAPLIFENRIPVGIALSRTELLIQVSQTVSDLQTQ